MAARQGGPPQLGGKGCAQTSTGSWYTRRAHNALLRTPPHTCLPFALFRCCERERRKWKYEFSNKILAKNYMAEDGESVADGLRRRYALGMGTWVFLRRLARRRATEYIRRWMAASLRRLWEAEQTVRPRPEQGTGPPPSTILKRN